MTLTEAPELTSLAELGHEWRWVATQNGLAESPAWNGDLSDIQIRRRFSAMIYDHQIITVQRKIPGGFMIFAKISQDVDDPVKAHTQSLARAQIHRSWEARREAANNGQRRRMAEKRKEVEG